MGEQNGAFPFEADADSSVPLWVQLRKRIVYLIGSGYFKPGDQLPKIRELAADISINFNTVNKAYLSLQSDGYLKSVRGKGVFVTDLGADAGAQGGEVEAVLDDCLHACRNLGAELRRGGGADDAPRDAPQDGRGAAAARGRLQHHRARARRRRRGGRGRRCGRGRLRRRGRGKGGPMSREGKRRDVAAAGEGGARRAGGCGSWCRRRRASRWGERASATGVVLFSALVFAVALLVVAGVGTLLAGAFTAWVALAAFPLRGVGRHVHPHRAAVGSAWWCCAWASSTG